VRIPFLRALSEVPWLGPVVSAVLLAMLVNLLTDALTTWGGLRLGWVVIGVLTLITVAFVYAYHVSETRRRARGLGPVIDLPNPNKHRGLIFLFSREETLREAIQYHLPTLEHCWLLVTPEMQPQAQAAVGHFPNVRFAIHPVPDRYNTQACYQDVRHIYEHDALRLGIAPQEIIADITGGTKPMTMGMIMASLKSGFAIEHIPTAYDVAGQPTGPLPPIEIRVQRGG
jgi:hypothetical protein